MTEPGWLVKCQGLYESIRSDLYHGAPGKWVLIHDGALLGIYATRAEAVGAGYQLRGNVPFYVEQISLTDKMVIPIPGWRYEEWPDTTAALRPAVRWLR